MKTDFLKLFIVSYDLSRATDSLRVYLSVTMPASVHTRATATVHDDYRTQSGRVRVGMPVTESPGLIFATLRDNRIHVCYQ